VVTGHIEGIRARVFETSDEIARLDGDRSGLVIVAHPDDETLWAGGQMLLRRDWIWTVVAMCRGSDPDRKPRFFRALKQLNARGRIADLDDEPNQRPLSDAHVCEALLAELDESKYDLMLTHSPDGEYTRHRRHEEVSRAVLGLWENGRIDAPELWLFAYHDNGGDSRPMPIEQADLTFRLSRNVWLRKRDIIEKTYGFGPGSWEYDTTPATEAFWSVQSAHDLSRWPRLRRNRSEREESTHVI
jgi:LmbE family N-acetylglucosaminyl deacetylase